MDSLLLNPYNPSNIPIERDVLERIIGFKTNDLSIYQNAFVHKSYCKKVETQTTNSDGVAVELIECPKDCMELQEESNERLEFLGDSILGAVVTSYLYRRYDKDEGFCTKLKTKLVNSSTLAKLSSHLGLEKYVIISKHVEERCNGRDNPRILEDLFEALIGAIFLDFNRYSLSLEGESFHSGMGYHVAERFIINILETTIDFTQLIKHDYNYKDIILRYYQREFHITPKYSTIKVEGPPNERLFTMAVFSPDNKIVGIGKERSKKRAEQLASRVALKHYGVLEESESDSEMSDSEEE